MATINYLCNGQSISAQAQNPHFLLTNKNTDYLALGNPNHSNYDGFFVRTSKGYMKIFANLAPVGETQAIELQGTAVVRRSADATQEFILHEQGVLMEGKGRFLLTLDCKQLYDESDTGRFYRIDLVDSLALHKNDLANNHVAVVQYTKYTDASQSTIAYQQYVCISTTLSMDVVGRWREATYEYDRMRGTHNTPWVYDALMLSGSGVVAVAAAETALEAQHKAFRVLAHHQTPALVDAALSATAQLAWRSLAGLQTKTGIMAGLPWFFQEWSRDELISLGGLLAAKRYDDVIRSLDKWYAVVRSDGTLPAIYPDQGLASSDAPGWLGKRTRDLLVRLSDENILHQLPQEKIARWRDLSGALFDRCATRIKDGLICSETNTTWMDTSSNDDGRAGARIEIQALFLALYDAHAHLCTLTKARVSSERSDLAKQVVLAVHKDLVKSGVLLDGLHADGTPDTIVRPNLFIAWYVAPKLFTDDEWRGFFRAALPKLWLSWGGLASLDTSSNNFHARYTGEDVASYHRGDSWYFVNNIAAMALHAIDSREFSKEVQQILAASTHDMLAQGYCGHCSELSCAEEQVACGTHAQAWSASTLIEAVQRIK